MRGVVFFDVDGTLVPDGSSAQFIAAHLGHLAPLKAAEDAYLVGEVDNRHVADVDASGWRGASVDEVRGWLPGLTLVDGIADVVDWCKSEDLLPVLATLAWTVVGDYLCDEFGFAERVGNELEVADGRFTGQVRTYVDEFEKLAFARSVAQTTGVDIATCAAIGDARSDIPLFDEVGLSIAFNGDEAASAAARVCVEGTDLRAALPALTAWFGAPSLL
jgi:phosphoserine phosphatase